MKKATKRRAWSTTDVRALKTLARRRTSAGNIAKKLKRTEGRRDKKHLVLVCRLTLAFSCPLLGKGELHETAPLFFCVTNDAMLTMR